MATVTGCCIHIVSWQPTMDHIGGYDATLHSYGWPSFELGVGPSKLDGWMCSATCLLHALDHYVRKENKKVTSAMHGWLAGDERYYNHNNRWCWSHYIAFWYILTLALVCVHLFVQSVSWPCPALSIDDDQANNQQHEYAVSVDQAMHAWMVQQSAPTIAQQIS